MAKIINNPQFPLETIVCKRGNPIATSSAIGSNVALYSVQMPALGPYDSVILTADANITNNANAKVLGFYYGATANALTTPIYTFSATAQATISPEAELSCCGVTNVQQLGVRGVASSTSASTAINLANPWWLTVHCNITTAGTVALRNLKVQIQRGGA